MEIGEGWRPLITDIGNFCQNGKGFIVYLPWYVIHRKSQTTKSESYYVHSKLKQQHTVKGLR